jgi:hypothetical protein
MTKHIGRIALCLAALALSAIGGPGQAWAATPAFQDLTVTFGGSLDVKIDGAFNNTYALGTAGSSQILATASTATITNASGGLTEQWSLSVSTVAGGGDWAVTTSTGNSGANATTCTGNCPGLDQFALQAVFVSSLSVAAACPNNSSKWDTVVSTVGVASAAYRSYRYGDPALFPLVTGPSGLPDVASGTKDGNMYGFANSGRRGLCTRLIMPSGSSSPTQQTIRLTITASAGL